VQPEKPTYGTTNIFNKEGLGLFKDVWNANAVDDWTAWSFSTPAAIENYWTTEMRTPPVIVSVIPTNANTTVCEGFEALNWLGIAEWRFQYCTNK
ncbi:MAG: hypothetical protein L6437_06415, partial [Kiritimatiellae bacterium]|nr:hypothetical protein [Kiritimatiellia bacterium]